MAVKLFVGGLSFSTSNERLREVFAATGSVESAAVVTDRDTGRSRGFGFVEMATPEDAEQAISKLNGTSVDGRTIQVERAVIAVEAGERLSTAIDRVLEAPADRVPHVSLKDQAKGCRGAVRTGEYTRYANVILTTGVAF